MAVLQSAKPEVASDFSVYSEFYKAGHYIAGLDGLKSSIEDRRKI